MEPPIPDHFARDREATNVPNDNRYEMGFWSAAWWQVWQDRPSTTQPTRNPHVNRVGLVRIAVDEWTVAGRVDCGMLCEELNDVHVELELHLSHNGSKTYDGVKLGV